MLFRGVSDDLASNGLSFLGNEKHDVEVEKGDRRLSSPLC